MSLYFVRTVLLSISGLSALFLYTETHTLFIDGYNQTSAINLVLLIGISYLSTKLLFSDKQSANPLTFSEKQTGIIFLVLGLASAAILGIRLVDDLVITPDPASANPFKYLFAVMGCFCIKTFFDTRKGGAK
ncbi:TPA: hypothetical protein I7730_00600 [Vibrio vulnificus]|uniref:Uncharacterized protein n=1 Tax=Vibrio vulnificus TaxID=672 RepID=A0A8H9K5N5_VIBVL|nr:hypothetical protein [Vibrio vulnificus]